MVYYNLLTFLLIFFTSCSVHYVSARSISCVAGGSSGQEKDLYYHVSVEGKKNQSQQYVKFGSGAIIGPKFVLAAAQYFFEYETLKNYRFSIAAGYAHPRDAEDKIIIDIDTIYLPDFDIFFSTFNIAVAQLEKPLDIGNHPRLMAVELPIPNKSFSDMYANASAFEDFYMPKLLCSFVYILSPADCKYKFPLHNISSTHMCGELVWTPENHLAPNFHKVLNHGSPLVIKGVIVGIVNLSPFVPRTHDTDLYTRVSNFTEFITAVMEGETHTRFVYKNHPHKSWF